MPNHIDARAFVEQFFYSICSIDNGSNRKQLEDLAVDLALQAIGREIEECDLQIKNCNSIAEIHTRRKDSFSKGIVAAYRARIDYYTSTKRSLLNFIPQVKLIRYE